MNTLEHALVAFAASFLVTVIALAIIGRRRMNHERKRRAEFLALRAEYENRKNQ